MKQQHIYQVSELTKQVRFLLESEMATLWLTGEISNLVRASSGHWYLSLKDSQSQVRCAMFKNANQRVRLNVANGQQVLVRVKVSLYEPRGDFQLIIEQMDAAGDGLLRQAYEKLKLELTQAGYFAADQKQPLPKKVNTIGVVTSATGAAVKDILTVLARRNPLVNVVIYPCLVQGEQAANDIANTIALANRRKECDLLIVGRGGGSLEDLWCFNERQVVQAIADSQLPVISAVGHEIDTTLADYAADMRAPTPSAAAELAVKDQLELRQQFVYLNQQLASRMGYKVNLAQQKLQHYTQRLIRLHPEYQIQQQQQQIDNLQSRLLRAFNYHLSHQCQQPRQLHQRLMQHRPDKQLTSCQERLSALSIRLVSTMQRQLHAKEQHFAHHIEQLQLVSPLATIARGYSVTRNQQGKIIKHCHEVAAGEQVAIAVSDGTILATVNG